MTSKIHDELDEFRLKLIAFLMADKLNIEVENVDNKNYEITITLNHKDFKKENNK